MCRGNTTRSTPSPIAQEHNVFEWFFGTSRTIFAITAEDYDVPGVRDGADRGRGVELADPWIGKTVTPAA